MIVDIHRLGSHAYQAVNRETGEQIGATYPSAESARGGVRLHAKHECVALVVPEPGAVEAWEAVPVTVDRTGGGR